MEDAAPKSEYNGASLLEQGTKWMERIRAAEKRESTWRKDAEAAERAFSCDADGKTGKLYDFNILHSNVETIVPAIYNSTPIPDIRRRFVEAIGEPPAPPQVAEGQQPDPRAMLMFQQEQQAFAAKQQQDTDAKSLGDMIERVISVQIDDNRLDIEIESEAQDSFLGGRGLIRLRFEANTQGEAVSGEKITFEAVSWRDFRMGPGTRWDTIPWIAFRLTLPREQLEKHSDKEMMVAQGPEVPTIDQDSEEIAFWEIWCKDSRKVKLVRENDGRMLKETEDPLGLSGFYPIPAPVQPITLTGKMTPVCPFTVYKKLADELDTITKRINAIMKGLKVRGAIAGDATDIANLANAGDNELVVIANLEALAQTKGIENAIMWWPIEQSIKVLKELYVQREQVKSSIYEITGISDIVRGASNANETLGAQEIKTKWGALRIQKMQRMIERQVRDVFVMMADLIITKFSPQTLQVISGIQITPGMQALMQQPTLAGYRVDVESDSTVRADLTRQKGEMTEFLAGTGQFFGAMGPVVQQAPEMAEPMSEVYSSFARVFKLGKQAEDALERMSKMAKQAASQPRPNPEEEKAKAEMALKEQDHQATMVMKKQESDAKAKEHDQTMQMKSEEHTFKMAEMKAQQDARIVEQAAKADDRNTQRQQNDEKMGFERQKHTHAMEARDKDMQAAQQTEAAKQTQAVEPVMQGLQQIAELVATSQEATLGAIEKLQATVEAPNELVRDPKTGKATGSRKVMN